MLNRVIYPEGCNWWCRRKQDILGVSKAFFTGGVIGALSELADILTSRIDSTYFDNIVLTPDEEFYLDNWYSKFEPYYKSILSASDEIIIGGFSNQNLINATFQKIYSLKRYYSALRSDSKLSTDAFNARKNLVVNSMQEVEDALFYKGEEAGLYKTSYIYDGLVITGLTAGSFKAIGFTFTNIKPTIPIFEDTSSPISEEIEGEITTSIDDILTTGSSSENTDQSSNNGKFIKILGGTILIAGIIYGLSRKSKKKK